MVLAFLGGNWGGRPAQDARSPPSSLPKDKAHITCFGCNKKEHYRSEFPDGSPTPHQSFRWEGWVNGCPCPIVLDTGADIIAVPKWFVAQSQQYTGEVFNGHVANVQPEQWQGAKVRMEVDRNYSMCVGWRGQISVVRYRPSTNSVITPSDPW